MTLGTYYRACGESRALHQIEAALTAEWRTTGEVARAAGRSAKFARSALGYLLEERRAEARRVPLGSRGKRFAWTWRIPRSGEEV